VVWTQPLHISGAFLIYWRHVGVFLACWQCTLPSFSIETVCALLLVYIQKNAFVSMCSCWRALLYYYIYQGVSLGQNSLTPFGTCKISKEKAMIWSSKAQTSRLECLTMVAISSNIYGEQTAQLFPWSRSFFPFKNSLELHFPRPLSI